MKKTTLKLILIVFLSFISIKINAQRIVQDLDRGVVAIHSETAKAFVSWRLFATEPSNTGFNLYRKSGGGAAVKLNTAVLTAGTNFTDATANFSVSNEYFVKAVLNGVEQTASRSFTMPANTPVQSYMSLPLRQDRPYYTVRYVRAGDLDGDGDYDYVVVRNPDLVRTPSQYTSTFVEAYKQDGTFLWQLDCGPNSEEKDNTIEPGSATVDVGHGDNITVYDINEDGKAEVIIRTSNGVKFGDGTVLSNPSNDDVQFISVLNGMTGTEISRTPYNNPYLEHGPMNGHFGIAYLDGIHPSLVWEAKNRKDNGDFNDMTTAWDWKNETLVQKWQFFLDQYPKQIHQQTGHQIRVIDLDGDGKDEICALGFVIDDDGSMLYNMADQDIFHGDRFYIGDMDPSRSGLEMYGIQQGYSTSGIMWYYADAKTGKILLDQKNPANLDMARGNVGDYDPRFPGFEFHTFTDYLYNVSGAPTSNGGMPSSDPTFRIFWDGDLLTEELGDKRMTKWNWLKDKEDRIFIDGFSSFNGIHDVGPNTPSFVGDILGDWREEVIYESLDLTELRIYTTPIASTERIYTLSQNPAYLNDLTLRGYYQGHLTDFYIGDGMQEPPVSPIQKADRYWTGATTSTWDTTTSNWETNSGSALYANPNIVMFDARGNNSNPINLSGNFSPTKVWVMNPESKDYVFSGTGKLTGTMDFVKSLSGSVTFNGNYDYTGTTVVSDGVLNVNGSIESQVTIKPKGAIGGIGTYKGGVVLEKGFNSNGGRINPGKGADENSIGSLVINGNLVVPGNNNFAFDIIPGSTTVNDKIIVNGNINFSGKNTIIVAFKDDDAIAGTYSLMKSNATLTAVATDFTVEGINGVPNEIIIENNEIKLNILALRNPGTITWKSTVNNKWDFDTKNFNLTVQEAFAPKDAVIFDETGLIKNVDLSVIANTSGVTFNATSDYTLSGTGAIDGTGDLIKSNTNKVTLDLTKNTYTGKTIINGGTLSVSTINKGGEPSSIGAADKSAGNIVINNGTLQINQNSSTDRVMTITGTSKINTSSATKYAVFTGEITGSGNLVKEGPGSLLLYKNSYSGATTLKEGKIYLRGNLGNEGGLGTGSKKLTIESGSLIMDDNRDLYDSPLWDIQVSSGKTGEFIPSGKAYLGGKLTGAGTLNVTIPYIRTSFKGDWSAFTGILNIKGDFRLDNTFGYANATINLAGNPVAEDPKGKAYSLNTSRTIKFGALNGDATISIYDANWEIGAKNSNSIFDGVIKSRSLTKVGTGSLTLTGDNIYTGVTNVNGGKLIVNNTTGKGTGTGALTVNTGATLSGTGILVNTVSIANGGTLAPGAPLLGTLTVNNAVSLQSGSTFETDVYAGSNTSDVLATGTNQLTLNGTLKLVNQNASAFSAGNSYKIFDGSNIVGVFTTIVPATPGTGLVWDISALKTTGVIAVIGDPMVTDTDADGVVDGLDLCSNTPSGTAVNSNGCTTISQKAITAYVVTPTCPDEANGKIKVSTNLSGYDYTINIKGNGVDQTHSNLLLSPTTNWEKTSLSAGTYQVTVAIPSIRFEQTYGVAVNEISAITAKRVVTDKSLSYAVSGSNEYVVTVNGVSNTYIPATNGDSQIEINNGLLRQNNLVTITSKNDCQGFVQDTYTVNSAVKLYPNPTTDIVNIEAVNEGLIQVYNTMGMLLLEKDAQNTKSINLKGYAAGMYLIKITQGASVENYKIILK